MYLVNMELFYFINFFYKKTFTSVLGVQNFVFDKWAYFAEKKSY